MLVTTAGWASGLEGVGAGFDVRTSSVFCPDWAADAGTSNANRQETNPKARQDKTMMRIELAWRKFFSVKTRMALSPDASGRPIPVLVTCGQGRRGIFIAHPRYQRNFPRAQSISFSMISPCHGNATSGFHQHLSYGGISDWQFAGDGESFALRDDALSKVSTNSPESDRICRSRMTKSAALSRSQRKARKRKRPE
jgi:hypothetical protein